MLDEATYRQHAAELIEMAESCQDARDRASLTSVANSWLVFADRLAAQKAGTARTRSRDARPEERGEGSTIGWTAAGITLSDSDISASRAIANRIPKGRATLAARTTAHR